MSAIHLGQEVSVRTTTGAGSCQIRITAVHWRTLRLHPSGVQGARRVALAQDEAVPLRVARPGRVHVEDGAIQGRQDVDDREIAADVSQAGAPDHFQVGQADTTRQAFHRMEGRLQPRVGQAFPRPEELLRAILIHRKHHDCLSCEDQAEGDEARTLILAKKSSSRKRTSMSSATLTVLPSTTTLVIRACSSKTRTG